MLTKAALTIALVMFVGAASSAPRTAGRPGPEASLRTYDGKWSILVMTERGTCDSAYRYALRIENGEARYDGGTDFTMSGRVAANGAVKGFIARGSARADVVGSLSGEFGEGTWRTNGSDPCSGSWTAERRA